MSKALQPRVFIGSSREALDVARGISANLDEFAEVRIWDEDLFDPGKYTLDELLRFTNSFDFAIFVWSGDDKITSRGEEFVGPRDNVLLEAGLFYGALGKERVFVFAPRESKVKTPSDLFGLAVLYYRQPTDNNFRSATSNSSLKVANKIMEIGSHPRTLNPLSLVASIPKTITSLREAKYLIRDECKASEEIRILSNKGLVFFGLDDSIISSAETADFSELKRLRIILLDPNSRWVNRGLMALRQHESLENFKKELSASHKIVEAGMRKFAKTTNLHRSGIKYNLVEPYFRMVLTNKLAFVSSYAENPTTQVRDLPVHVYENISGSLYGAFKRHFNDLWHNNSKVGEYIQDTIETEVSAGGILVKHNGSDLLVALVMRDDGSWVLPKGHKERAEETLESAAIREVTEEIGVVAKDISIIKSLDEYSFDEIAEKYNSNKVVYLFLMEYKGHSLPKLKSDPDHVEAKWWSLKEKIPYMFYSYQRTLLAQVIKNEFGIDVVHT